MSLIAKRNEYTFIIYFGFNIIESFKKKKKFGIEQL